MKLIRTAAVTTAALAGGFVAGQQTTEPVEIPVPYAAAPLHSLDFERCQRETRSPMAFQLCLEGMIIRNVAGVKQDVTPTTVTVSRR